MKASAIGSRWSARCVGEQRARHREIDDGADDQQRPSDRMHVHNACARASAAASASAAIKTQATDVVVDREHQQQAVELAGQTPNRRARRRGPRSGSVSSRRSAGRNGTPVATKSSSRVRERLRDARVHSRCVSNASSPSRRGRAQTDGRRTAPRTNSVEAHIPPRPGTLAQRDPGRQRPQRQTDAEHVVHHADQQHARCRGSGSRRAAPPTSGRRERGGARTSRTGSGRRSRS